MKNRFLPVHKILVATLTGFSFASVLVASPSLADTNPSFGTLESDKNNNLLSPTNSDFNMFDLIHNANLSIGPWDNQAKNQELDATAADFRARQQKLLQTQQKSQPVTPTTQNQPPAIAIPTNQ